MIVRRLPMLALVVIVAIALVLIDRDPVSTPDPVFSQVASPWMPAAPSPGGLSSTWYCPGVPAAPAFPLPTATSAATGDSPPSTTDGENTTETTAPADAEGDDRTAGEVAVFNPDADPMRGTITILTEQEGEPLVQSFEVAAYGSQRFDVDELVDSAYAAAVVEIEGGGGLVEQKATWPVGTNSVAESVSPCANSPADRWYFATGDTSDGSQDLLVLSNPHDHGAIVDIELATSRGVRSIDDFAVPPKSVRTIDLREHTVDDEVNVGVSIVATRGSLVVGRAQLYDQPERDGYSMVLGAPSLRFQWWFAAGEVADDVTVEYSIYNPGDDDVTVNPVYVGFDAGADYLPPEPVVVPAGQVVVVTLGDTPGIPDGPVSAIFGTDGGEIVVERTITRAINGIRTTSVTPGATARIDDYVANTWYLGIGPVNPTERALQLVNVDGGTGTVTVQAITDDGLVTVPSLSDIPLAGFDTITIDLTDPLTEGHALIVRSTTRIFVERVLPREPNAQGRVASWLLPAG